MTHSWQRLSAETSTAYAAFCAYRDLGPDRSLDKTSQTHHKSVNTMRRWSERFSWVERATAYDDYMTGIAQAEYEKVLRKQSEVWTKRQLEHREKAFKVAQDLLAKAEQMMQFPLATVRKDDGDKVTYVEPARWSFSDAARLVDTADKVTRLAAELPTEIIKMLPELQEALEKQGIDITDFIRQAVERAKNANANR